jgi:hypothetical protein
MTVEEARLVVRKHAGRSEKDGNGDSFLGMLRPYRRLHEEYFQELMGALKSLGPSLGGSRVDRDLIADLWELVFLAWLWALAPTSKVRRNGQITDKDQEILAGWLEEIGLTISLMLGGEEVPNAPSARKMISSRRV